MHAHMHTHLIYTHIHTYLHTPTHTHTHTSRCRELVEKGGVDLNKGDEENITVLHWAAINNRIPVVSFFLQRGADINAIGGELKSPAIHWATR